MASNKMNSFAKQFLAFIKGDDAEAKAQKVWRQADSAFKVQIAALSGDLIRKEDEVSKAEENLSKALVNAGYEIGDRDMYIFNLISAKQALNGAERELQSHKDTIAFLEEQYALLKAE